jgi:hypothetical protein
MLACICGGLMEVFVLVTLGVGALLVNCAGWLWLQVCKRRPGGCKRAHK